jgi:hypothetical protein
MNSLAASAPSRRMSLRIVCVAFAKRGLNLVLLRDSDVAGMEALGCSE